MKIKEIEVGKEYAMGSATGYGSDPDRLERVRVVRVGVRGLVPDGWRTHASKGANYVEYERVGKDRRGQTGDLVKIDPESGELARTKGSFSREYAEGSVDALRCLGTKIRRIWSENEVLVTRGKERDVADEVKKKENAAKTAALVARFEAVGMTVYITHAGGALKVFGEEEVERIVMALEEKAAAAHVASIP